jgi:ATP-dependent helicase HrpA
VPPITFPESLPVSGRREEIAQALQTHQVVIVCGETGSGKTTQLPKIALALGRGLGAGGSGLIGHTQPRRIAASSVAKRIAEELNTPLGEVVGYKVRFNDRLQPGASVKLMTDGILLAETQTDPLLKAYDTIIIDEAHERSLNIDFLLGYLRQILPRRPDLKIIVTSATIDADRFAQHFLGQGAGADHPRQRPHLPGGAALPPSKQRRDLNDAIADAVDELWREGRATSWSSCPASARSARRPTTCASTCAAHGPQPDPAAVRAPVAGRAGPRLQRATAGASCWPPTWPRPR